MKKLYLIVLFTCGSMMTFAQMNEVQNAIINLQYNDLDKAKIAIDKATLNPKTSTNPKMWITRAKVYKEIYKSEKYKSLEPNALAESMLALERVSEFDTKKNYELEGVSLNTELGNLYYNSGIVAFKDKDFDKALTIFETLASNKNYGFTNDTNTVFNAALAAERAGNLDKTISLNKRLMDMKFENPNIYFASQRAYLAKGDTASGLSMLDEGRKVYPNNAGFLTEKINVFLAANKEKDALISLNDAIKLEPDNKTLHYALGTLYDKAKNIEMAEKSYRKAIEIDPDYFEANYNLGALFFNKGVEVLNKANDLSDIKLYEKEKVKFDALFKNSLPYLEKALEVNEKDRDTLISLKQLYARTGDLAKSEEMKKKLEALPKN